MGLEAAGYSALTRFDFNLAVKALAKRIEEVSQETVQVTVPAPPKPPQGSVHKLVPRYSLRELLMEEPSQPENEDAPIPDQFKGLDAALLD